MAKDSKEDKEEHKEEGEITEEEKSGSNGDRAEVDKDESEQLPEEQIQEHPEH